MAYIGGVNRARSLAFVLPVLIVVSVLGAAGFVRRRPPEEPRRPLDPLSARLSELQPPVVSVRAVGLPTGTEPQDKALGIARTGLVLTNPLLRMGTAEELFGTTRPGRAWIFMGTSLYALGALSPPKGERLDFSVVELGPAQPDSRRFVAEATLTIGGRTAYHEREEFATGGVTAEWRKTAEYLKKNNVGRKYAATEYGLEEAIKIGAKLVLVDVADRLDDAHIARDIAAKWRAARQGCGEDDACKAEADRVMRQDEAKAPKPLWPISGKGWLGEYAPNR